MALCNLDILNLSAIYFEKLFELYIGLKLGQLIGYDGYIILLNSEQIPSKFQSKIIWNYGTLQIWIYETCQQDILKSI